ncbi:hypothetical protein LXL04_021400 [Taraxacum kok-saghyz]
MYCSSARGRDSSDSCVFRRVLLLLLCSPAIVNLPSSRLQRQQISSWGCKQILGDFFKKCEDLILYKIRGLSTDLDPRSLILELVLNTRINPRSLMLELFQFRCFCFRGLGYYDDAEVQEMVLSEQLIYASLAAEDYARRFESGIWLSDRACVSNSYETKAMKQGIAKDLAADEQGLLNAKVMCRLCFSGENEEIERAKKMLSCKNCNKKYHRTCVKSWAPNRDLFHWSSWTCPSCRTCEVCRRTGDPNKLMYCKRCDGAYHCYCQQPPHKNVSTGPYLCPKHTKCHSCASTVPGNERIQLETSRLYKELIEFHRTLDIFLNSLFSVNEVVKSSVNEVGTSSVREVGKSSVIPPQENVPQTTNKRNVTYIPNGELAKRTRSSRPLNMK